MEAGTRMGQGQRWGYEDRTLWQNWASFLNKLEHLNKILSLQKCKGEVAFPTTESPWSPPLLPHFPFHLPICHDKAVMQTLPMHESPQHRLIMRVNPSIFIHRWGGVVLLLYPVSESGWILLLSIHTHPPPFSSQLSSTHTFSWKEIRNHSLLQWEEQEKFRFKNVLASLLQFSFPGLFRALLVTLASYTGAKGQM